MYAIHFGFLFQNLNVTFFFLSSHMYDKKKKLQHIFQLFQDKKKKERNDFVQSFFWPLSTFYYFPEVWSWGTWVPEYCQQPFVAPNGCSRGHGEGTRHYQRGTEGSPEEKILYNSLLFSSSHVLLIKCVVYKYPWNIVEHWYNLVMNHWIIIFVTFNFCIFKKQNVFSHDFLTIKIKFIEE